MQHGEPFPSGAQYHKDKGLFGEKYCFSFDLRPDLQEIFPELTSADDSVWGLRAELQTLPQCYQALWQSFVKNSHSKLNGRVQLYHPPRGLEV